MRTPICVLGMAVLVATSALAGYVIHDNRDGIVAERAWESLDSYGRVWKVGPDLQWERRPELDPPVQVEHLLFWECERFLTKDYEVFWFIDGEWHSAGFWPDSPAAGLKSPTNDPGSGVAAFPNPTGERSRIAFTLQSPGEISVQIVDLSGRVIRHLLEGEHPAGGYDLVWDGKDASGRNVAAGSYYCLLTVNGNRAAKRAVVIR